MNRGRNINRAINWKLWSGLIISAVFLCLAFREVDWTRTWSVIVECDAFLLALVVAITFFQFIIRAWRWRIFLKSVRDTGFSNRFTSVLIGFAANCIFPARLGEFVRANYLGKAENISRSSTFGTIVVERLFDGFTLLVILVIGLMGTGFPEELKAVEGSLRATGLSLFLAYGLVVAFIAGFRYRGELFLGLLERIFFFIPGKPRSRLVGTVRKLALGLVPVEDCYGWAQAIFYSLLLWFSSLCQISLISYSIGMSIPFIATFMIMAMASFGVMIPSAPGFIGTFHLAVQYGFILYGVGREEALSAAILLHAAFFFPTIFLGGLGLLWFRISNKEEASVVK